MALVTLGMGYPAVGWTKRLRSGLLANGLAGSTMAVLERTLAVLGVVSILHQLVLDDFVSGLSATGLAVIIGGVLGIQKCSMPRTRQGSRGRTKVSITFSDLFDAPPGSHLVVGVNERFDSSVGERVSLNSLHGQLIQRLFNGDRSRFEREVDEGLSTSRIKSISKDVDGERLAYPIGTTVVLQSGPRKIFAVAVARTNTENHQASCTVQELWTSLTSLWIKVREHSNGQPCYVPLLGTGFARVPLRKQAILELMLSSIEHESAQVPITAGGIKIILYPGDYRELDLRPVSLV